MTAILCTLLSGICFYFSIALGGQWWLAWLAPIPVLWLAFGEGNWRIAGLVCWVAMALGTLNLLPAYAGELPTLMLAVAIAVPGLLFAASVLGGRFVARRISPLAGVLAFASLWTGWDFLVSLGRNGTAISPAYSQVGAPVLIQGASVLGLWLVTFLLGFVAAGIAMSIAKRRAALAVAAIVVFVHGAGARRCFCDRAHVVHAGRPHGRGHLQGHGFSGDDPGRRGEPSHANVGAGLGFHRRPLVACATGDSARRRERLRACACGE